MTADQVPEPTAEQLKTGHSIAFDIITGATNGRSAEAIAAAISAAVAAERAHVRQVEHDAYLRGLSEGLGRMASVVNDAVRRLNESSPQ